MRFGFNYIYSIIHTDPPRGHFFSFSFFFSSLPAMPKTPEWLKNDGKEYTNRPPAGSNSSPVQILYGEIAETRKRRGAFFQHASV